MAALSGRNGAQSLVEEVREEDVLEGLRTFNSYTSGLNDLDLSKLDLDEGERIRSILKSGTKISILIVGKTGTGKSSLVNGLVGKTVANEGVGLTTTGTTQFVTPYHTKVREVEVTIYDSPGLQDGSGHEEIFLKEMKETCRDFDLMIFALKIIDNKFVPNNPDVVTMNKITTTFGSSVWKKATVALTCADAVEAANPSMRGMDRSAKVEFYRKLVRDYTSTIRRTLAGQVDVPEEITEKLKVIPTGHSSVKELLDGTLWFSNFWLECLSVIQSPIARIAMLRLNANRIRTTDNVNESDFLQELEDQPIVITRKESDDAKTIQTAGGVVTYGIMGAFAGCLGLIGGPVGAVGIPIGLFLGIVIGASVFSHS